MSSSSSSPRRLSRQASSKTTPLAERSQSQTNRPSLRLLQDNPDELTALVFSSTPFPTKPAHVLLPSAIRERQLGSNDENNVPGAELSSRFATANTKAKRLGSDITPEGRAVGPAPKVKLKRSVKALRDLYEAQAEKSRPSTATSPVTSPVLRPSTASSGLRSFSSREGLGGGPQAWELFHKAYSDEIGTLPSLDEVASTLRQIESQTSLTAPEPSSTPPDLLNIESPSSPPIRPIEESSSPNFEIVRESSSPGATVVDSSSPNVVRLAGSSSPTATSAEPSSPIVVKLGSSSPGHDTPRHSDIDEGFDESPDTVGRNRIHARAASIRDGTSFEQRMQNSDDFASSPPEPTHSSPMSSSAVDSSSAETPFPASSPPFETVTMVSELSNEPSGTPQDAIRPRSDLPSESHANLQVAIGSSPAPSVQYPTVHAPTYNDLKTLNVTKRLSRSMAGRYEEKWDPRLSTVPSEWSEEKKVRTGLASVDHDTSTDDSSSSSSDDDSFLQPPARAYLASSREPSGSTIRMVSEADREATDFIADLPPSEYRSLQLQQRSSGLLSILSSPGSRSNSMRNSVETRLNSMRSFTSSRHNSMSRSIRRPGSSSSLVSNLPIPTWARRYYSGGVPKDYFYSASQISSTTDLGPQPSTSAPRTPIERVTHIFRPRTRPRVPNPQQIHLEPGIGPLVSNPIGLRPVSIALDPADPRAHWAGAEETAMTAALNEAHQTRPHSSYRIFPSRRDWSPHLHQDPRSGGHPRRNPWHAPSMDENREMLLNWRNAQVLGFILGFVFPISWFIAAFLPLPPKPNLNMDEVSRIPTPNIEAQLQQRLDIQDDIRYENARWWRCLNRIMCAVGFVVIVLVVTLAAVYH
jgi:hypothetical protein